MFEWSVKSRSHHISNITVSLSVYAKKIARILMELSIEEKG